MRISKYNYPEIKEEEKYSPEKTSGEYFFINHFYKNKSIEFAHLTVDGSSKNYTFYEFATLDKATNISAIEYFRLNEKNDMAEIRQYAIQIPLQLMDVIITTHTELLASIKSILGSISQRYKLWKDSGEKQPTDIPEYLRETPGIYHLIYVHETTDSTDYYLVKIDYKSETDAKVFYYHWIDNCHTNTVFKNQESIFIYDTDAEYGDQYDCYCSFCPVTEEEYNAFIMKLNEWVSEHNHFQTSLFGLHL